MVVPWPELVPSVFVWVDWFVFVQLVFFQLCVFVPFIFVQFDYVVFVQFVIAVLADQWVVFV